MGSENNNVAKLQELAEQLLELRAQIQAQTDLGQASKEVELGPVLSQRLKDIDAATRASIAPLEDRLAGVEAHMKTLVVEQAETYKGKGFMVIYVNPDPTWDGAALRGYAAAHPEVEKFMTPGKPRAQLRWGR